MMQMDGVKPLPRKIMYDRIVIAEKMIVYYWKREHGSPFMGFLKA